MELNRTSFMRTFADCVNSVDSGSLLRRRLSSQSGRPSRINESGTVPQRSETSGIQHKFHGSTDVGVRSSSSSCSGTDIAIASDVHPPESADKVCSGRVAKRTKRSGQRFIRSRSGNEVETTPDECEPKAPKRSRGPEPIAGAKTRKTSLQVKNACTRCRHRKAKCSGTRPSCKHCMKRGLACSYDVAEGSTRSNDLKRKLQEASNRAHYFGCILAALRDGTDFQASQILARLRLGDSIPDVVRMLPVASSSPQDEPELAALDL